MAIKRIVSTEFWTDGKVVEQFTPEDKYFFLYLLTNPHTTQLGIYPFTVKIAAFELGYSPDAVRALLERFDTKYGLVMVSDETGEIAIRNYLKHSIVKGGAPVRDLLYKEASNVKDKALLKFVLDANTQNGNATVREFVVVMNNDNDNDNEDSVPNRTRIVPDSSKASKDNDSKPVKHKYGEYKNVLLSDTDLEKLKSEFPDWDTRIERLSEYIESKGAKYKNHLATIRVWAKKDKVGGKKVSFQNYDQGEEQIYTGPDLLKEAREARG